VSRARPAEGHFFEDFAVGRRFRHATPRTITEGDASMYIALTGARFPAHCAAPLARALGHPACPVDDLLVFNMAFGKTVPDVSYNAVANLGYADVRFLAPVYAGDTLACESEVVGAKANSNGKSGVVYVRSRALNQHGTEAAGAPVIPVLPKEVAASEFRVPGFLAPRALDAEATGSARLWDDYRPGETIDHPGGMTIEEADHMLATRLYQNTARIHFDEFRARDSQFGRRLVYGGHVISICRALSYEGLENAFAIAAIHGGTHSNPTFAGDTIYCRHVVTGKDALAGRPDTGALRLRMLGVKNHALARLGALAPGERSDDVVLDLDYSVLIPRRQNP
jgi:2-methylfumaryl-CoA hydratase